MHKYAQVSFSLGWFDLSDTYPPHGRYLIPAPNKPAEFLCLYLCMIYSTQSLKHRHNCRHPDRWIIDRALAAHRDVIKSVLGMLLEVEVEAEDNVHWMKL